MGIETYLYGPMDYAKTLKLRSRAEDLDLPERRKRCYPTWYSSSRVEEEEGARSCPCGNADESRAHIVGECEQTHVM